MKDEVKTRAELIAELEQMRGALVDNKKFEADLLDSQQRLSDIVNFLPDATFAIDLDGRIIIWNKAMEIMTGVTADSMIGKKNHEYSLPFYGFRRPILIDLVFISDSEIKEKYHFVRKTGDVLLAEADVTFGGKGERNLWGKASPLYDSAGNVIGAIEAIRDITDQKTAEKERNQLFEHLQRAEKMEALGNLAGGVAHDLNNVLGVIVGYTELMLHGITKENPLSPQLHSILKSGNRAAAIVQDLLTLARRGVYVKEVFNLNRIVEDFFESAEFVGLRSYHPNVTFQNDLEQDLMNSEGSPTHFEKSLFNLVCNAAEAMPDGGEIVISTKNSYLDAPVENYEHINEGHYILLSVSDTGEGISKDDLNHIFEPFYTKKVMGKSGTGLGLAVVWGTIKDHRGYIQVKNNDQTGTIFNLYIPASKSTLHKPGEIDNLSRYRGTGNEHILVVDDVMAQGAMAVKILTKLGYPAVHVTSGELAIEYLKANSVQLVILDMIMDPGMDGLETYIEIQRINPHQRAIIISGYAETKRVSKIQALGGGSYLKKPYKIEMLGKAVREELDRER